MIKIATMVLLFGMFFISGCSSIYDYEDEGTYISDEIAFMNILSEVGLDWSSSISQSLIPESSPYHDVNSYLITCPSNLILGFIVNRDGFGGVFGERHMHTTFRLYRQPSEYEFNDIKQNGLLTDNELLSFWKLIGIALSEEDTIAIIASQSMEYLRNFLFNYKTEHPVTVMEGNSGNIDYRFVLSWNPMLEMYAQYEIGITVGLSEFFREYRKDFYWLPW